MSVEEKGKDWVDEGAGASSDWVDPQVAGAPAADDDAVTHLGKPAKGKVVVAVRVLRAFVIIAALGLLGAIIWTFFDKSPDEFIDWALRIYTAAFCLIIVLAELGLPKRLRAAAILRFWAFRGVLYGYVGFVAVSMANDQDGDAERFEYLMGWIVVGIGALYLLLGLFCLNKLYDHKVDSYHENKQAHKALKKAGKSGATIDAAAPVDTAPEA